jgi:hypothetical protein
MVKKKCCDWNGKEWLGVVVSEVALFGFFYYLLMLLGVALQPWLSALILLLLINIMFFACPAFRKHYL